MTSDSRPDPEVGEIPEDLPRLPARRPQDHKGTYGRVLLVGGSRGMTGAAVLMGMSALRSGAGLVRLAVPDRCLDAVAIYEPSYMTSPLASDPEGRISAQAVLELPRLLENVDAVGCGPGLGQSDDVQGVVAWLYDSCQAPLVLDADALNALAGQRSPRKAGAAAGPRILTPHPGEFRRLLGNLAQKPSVAEMRQRAPEWAAERQVVLVLKGHRTLVTNGRDTIENPTGNPGMATGGTGDVLTGILTAFLGQGLKPFDAARLATFVHGRAGDLAAADRGPVALIARDLIDYLPQATRQVVASPENG